MAHPVNPCGPPPPPAGVAAGGPRKHASCELCKLLAGEPVDLVCTNGTNYSGVLAEINSAGFTLETGEFLAYLPWSAIQALIWQPKQRTDVADPVG